MTEKELAVRRPKGFSDYARIYALYVSSFPLSERKPFKIIRTYEKRKKTDLWILEDGGRFSGFAATLNGENAILLDYLAVSGKKRGTGFGSAFLKKLLGFYRGKGVFVEIESVLAECSDAQARGRRRRFYLNNGFLPMNVYAGVFGVDMELLGVDVRMSLTEYRSFYRENYSAFAAKNITEPSFPPVG